MEFAADVCHAGRLLNHARLVKPVEARVAVGLQRSAESLQMLLWVFTFPDYIDADGDGYPENREVDGKRRIRLAVGFRTGSHTGASLPVSAEGPGAFLFTGIMDQTEIPLKIAASLGGDTTDLDNAVQKLLSTPAFPKTYGK